MKLFVLFTTLILSAATVCAIDIDMHGDINDTNDSYDIGFDFVTEESDMFITTGLYRKQFKNYQGFFDNDGFYVGFGKHFNINSGLSFAANAKIYESNNFSSPIYCVRLTQRFSLF